MIRRINMKNTFFEQNITEVNNYLTKIKADYHAWQDRCKDGCPEVKDKMFDGDILMAKSWAAPATNFARGNIFEDYTIRWTGAV
jgi:deoxyadenosine/deoxycytidine kinase